MVTSTLQWATSTRSWPLYQVERRVNSCTATVMTDRPGKYRRIGWYGLGANTTPVLTRSLAWRHWPYSSKYTGPETLMKNFGMNRAAP